MTRRSPVEADDTRNSLTGIRYWSPFDHGRLHTKICVFPSLPYSAIRHGQWYVRELNPIEYSTVKVEHYS